LRYIPYGVKVYTPRGTTSEGRHEEVQGSLKGNARRIGLKEDR
jgi:hypothetical protein